MSSLQGLVPYLLIGLCANYPHHHESEEFNCTLRNVQDKKDFFKGKELKIVTYDEDPLSIIVHTPSGELQGKGIVFELIDTLQEKFGFKYELIPGTREMGNEKSGLLGMLTKGDADMIAGFLPVLPGTHSYVTWGTDLWQMTYYVMMKRPEDSASGSGLLAPFNKEVWFLILLSLLTVGPIIYFIMWLRIKLCTEEESQIFPLSSCIWFVYGALMKQGSTLTPISDSARLLFATWWIFILILTAFYTANLTAFLTLSLFTLPINEIEDVANPAHKWFTAKGGSVEYAIKNKEDGDLNLLMASYNKGRGKFLDTTGDSQVLKMVSDGWLYLNDHYSLTRLMFNDYKKKTENGIEESKRCTFVLTKKYFLIRSLGFAYQKGSFLPDIFNPVVQSFVESGILKHLMNAHLPETVICPLNLQTKERKLRNNDLYATYLVVLSGFTCALLVFCMEMVWRKYNTKKLLKKTFIAGVRNNNIYDKLHIENEFGKVLNKKNQQQIKINGRDYFMVNAKKGNQGLIPLRSPSAFLFQYGLNYPTIL